MQAQIEISREVQRDFLDKITHVAIADLTGPLRHHIMAQEGLTLSSN